MILLIKADKRPRKCDECKGWYKCEGWEKEPYTCPIVGEIADNHGRMINADELLMKVREKADFPSEEWCKAIECIENAPTVFEASKERE